MRERRAPLCVGIACARITPAYAGKTGIGPIAAGPDEDHPRVCGKDLNHYYQTGSEPGSPPRMRERPAVTRTLADKARITPAYAGKTSFASFFDTN